MNSKRLDIRARAHIEKSAFEVNINPASVIGAIVGTMTARNLAKKDAMAEIHDQLSINPPGSASSSYYKDVENFANNMKVRFTPLGVLYTVDSGNGILTVDEIGLNEMDPLMRSKFDMRDSDFFKNLTLNKIRSDIQLTESILAKRMIDRKLNSGLNKMANEQKELEFIKLAADTRPTSELVDYILTDEDYSNIKIGSGLSGDERESIFKYAGIFGSKLSFPSFGEKSQEELDRRDKLSDPKYVGQKANVMFLPDRVMFIVDGMVLGQLSVVEMNEEGFSAFERGDEKYFQNFFSSTLGVERNPLLDLFKRASEVNTLSGIFMNPVIHPMVYFNVLTFKYTHEWLEFDPEMLIKGIEEDFTDGAAVNELVVNKLWAIQAANNPSGIMFKNILAFEKMVRAMNGMPINFLNPREDNITLGEFAFALRALEDVTPYDDIYDNFSEGVLDYIENSLIAQNYLVIDINAVSDLERQFFLDVDQEVRPVIVAYKMSGYSAEEKASELKKIDLTVSLTKNILATIRSTAGYDNIDAVKDETLGRMEASFKYLDPTYWDGVENGVHMHVKKNIAVDAFLDGMKAQLDSIMADIAVFLK